MKSGAAFLLAVLLGVFLAVGQCGSGSADEDGDHGSSSSAADHDDSDDGDSDDGAEAATDEDSAKDDEPAKDEEPAKEDDGDSRAEALKKQLEGEGLQVADMSTASDDDCAAHAYGAVADFFADHPCTGLERAWYEVHDGDGSAVLAVAWVDMPDAAAATDLQELVDRPGTGNVTELTKDDGPHGDVRYSGWYYRSGRDGDEFHSVQAEPLSSAESSRDVARRAAGVTGTD